MTKEMYAAMDVAETLHSLYTNLEANHLVPEATLMEVRAANERAVTRAWQKMIKQHPGLCRYLYGARTTKIKRDIKHYQDAMQALGDKTEEGRKKAIKIIATLIVKISGVPDALVLVVPWLVEANWRILKWQMKQYRRLFAWLGKNFEEIGDIKTLREECKRTQPQLPPQIERAVRQNKSKKNKKEKPEKEKQE